eukprot:scaffold84286_cov63-Phaeocystis_antarctica.AAC.11
MRFSLSSARSTEPSVPSNASSTVPPCGIGLRRPHDRSSAAAAAPPSLSVHGDARLEHVAQLDEDDARLVTPQRALHTHSTCTSSTLSRFSPQAEPSLGASSCGRSRQGPEVHLLPLRPMPPKAASDAQGKVLRTARGEVLRVKSPAEFFSENKNIAGFDNPGKSLYTTIRELVENSLDACEAAGVLPDIEVTLHEIDKPALDKLVGITTHERLDTTLFEKASKEAKKRSGGGGSSAADGDGDGGKGKQETLYYKVMVRDNGCGMPHNTIPDSLGRVLAGSKYGVRQTRGKFGLGAKMALIWSKQSTGLPVEVRSATGPDKLLSVCVLDIDI